MTKYSENLFLKYCVLVTQQEILVLVLVLMTKVYTTTSLLSCSPHVSFDVGVLIVIVKLKLYCKLFDSNVWNRNKLMTWQFSCAIFTSMHSFATSIAFGCSINKNPTYFCHLYAWLCSIRKGNAPYRPMSPVVYFFLFRLRIIVVNDPLYAVATFNVNSSSVALFRCV